MILNLNSKDEAISAQTDSSNTSNTTFIPQFAIIQKLEQIKEEKLKDLQDEILKEKQAAQNIIDQREIAKIEKIFKKFNSPMQGYGNIIYNRAVQCGGNYKTLVAIAGNESGFGAVPYKKYNPFGYLDGVQYNGWQDSLSFLSCAISKRFIIPCNNDLNCIVKTYGGSNTNKPLWVRHITYYINYINSL